MGSDQSGDSSIVRYSRTPQLFGGKEINVSFEKERTSTSTIGPSRKSAIIATAIACASRVA
jgi:hypothetical protein